MSFASTKFESISQSTAAVASTANASLFKTQQYNNNNIGQVLTKNECVSMTLMSSSSSTDPPKSPTAAKAMRKTTTKRRKGVATQSPRSDNGETGVFSAEEPPPKQHNISSVS